MVKPIVVICISGISQSKSANKSMSNGNWDQQHWKSYWNFDLNIKYPNRQGQTQAISGHMWYANSQCPHIEVVNSDWKPKPENQTRLSLGQTRSPCSMGNHLYIIHVIMPNMQVLKHKTKDTLFKFTHKLTKLMKLTPC